MLLAADCNYESKAVTPLLATIDALLAPGGVLLIASRLARYGLADCLRRLGSTTAEGGLALRLDGVVSFDSDAHAIERREGGSAVAAAEVAEAEAAEAAARAGDASEDNAPHRLWIFTRSNATAAGEAGVADSKTVAVQTQPDLEAAAASCYHERQRLMRCGRHALNNLIGSAAFDTRTLDKFALQISGDGLGQAIAHRWPVLGNYDCNVILLALQQCGLAAEWWDKRRPESELHAALNLTESERACEEQQQPAAERGWRGAGRVLLNVRSRPKMFGGLVPLGRHWLALRPLAHTDRRWVDVDSHLERPRLRRTKLSCSRSWDSTSARTMATSLLCGDHHEGEWAGIGCGRKYYFDELYHTHRRKRELGQSATSISTRAQSVVGLTGQSDCTVMMSMTLPALALLANSVMGLHIESPVFKTRTASPSVTMSAAHQGRRAVVALAGAFLTALSPAVPPTFADGAKPKSRDFGRIWIRRSICIGNAPCQGCQRGVRIAQIIHEANEKVKAILGKSLSDVEYVSLDATSDDLKDVLNGASAVISCVGVAPGGANQRDGNGKANVNIANAAKAAGIDKFVYVGVASELSNGPIKFIFGDYVKGKAEAEAAVLKNFGASALVLRARHHRGSPSR